MDYLSQNLILHITLAISLPKFHENPNIQSITPPMILEISSITMRRSLLNFYVIGTTLYNITKDRKDNNSNNIHNNSNYNIFLVFTAK